MRSVDELAVLVVEFVIVSFELLLDELLFELFKLRSGNELTAFVCSVAEIIAINVVQFNGRLHCDTFSTNSSFHVRRSRLT